MIYNIQVYIYSQNNKYVVNATLEYTYYLPILEGANCRKQWLN